VTGASADSGSWESQPSMVDQAVRRRLLPRQEIVIDEVRRMLDAGVDLMRDQTRTVPPRVADIVAAAGASNDAFYRAFGSRDQFFAAIVDDGTRRLLSFVKSQRDQAEQPRARIRAGLEAILKQAGNESVARTTRAVLAFAPQPQRARALGSSNLFDDLGRLFEDPLREMGSVDPVRDARTLARTAVDDMDRLLWSQQRPSTDDIGYLMSLADRLTGGSGAEPTAPVRRGRRSS
jgi:AcrR family transcriptional regulator